MTIEQRLQEIYASLKCAIIQSLPSTDQIIMDHVRDALAQTNHALREIRAEAIAALVETLTEAA